MDKVEYILMGGTFIPLPVRRDRSCVTCTTPSPVRARRASPTRSRRPSTRTKCVGLTIETSPDYCLSRTSARCSSATGARLRRLAQSVYEDVARDANRGHTVAAVQKCFELAKDAGFKVVVHMMPDLPQRGHGARSRILFREVFENPDFRTDGLKLYPTLVIRGTGLYELWRTGQYRNYTRQTGGSRGALLPRPAVDARLPRAAGHTHHRWSPPASRKEPARAGSGAHG